MTIEERIKANARWNAEVCAAVESYYERVSEDDDNDDLDWLDRAQRAMAYCAHWIEVSLEKAHMDLYGQELRLQVTIDVQGDAQRAGDGQL